MMRAFIFILALLSFIPLSAPPAYSQSATTQSVQAQYLPKKDIVIHTQDGEVTLSVEVATTPQQRETGLMYRRSLDEKSGMLFIFEDVRNRSFWMKNTYIPLDIIFIDDAHEVMYIEENTVPFSLEPIPSNGAVKAVIEIAGGTASQLGIFMGDKVDY